MLKRATSKFFFIAFSTLVGVIAFLPHAYSSPFTPNGGQGAVNQGAYDYRLPLQLPPLPGRLQLDLSVAYSDRAGSGLFGSKADLGGLPKITRCAPSIVRGDELSLPVTMTDSDRLCLGGDQLRSTSGSYWQSGTVYRTSVETYTRVTRLDNGFKVEYKNGNIAYLTHTAVAQYSPYAWFAETIEDRFGNQVVVQYRSNSLSEALPESISYGQTVVSFQYTSGRKIKGYVGLAGGAIVKTRLIDDIEIAVQNQPIRRYDFAYSPLSVPNKNLRSVTECGKSAIGDTQWVCAQAAAFSWEPYSGKFDASVVTSARRELTSGDGRWLVDVLQGDWNGDGIADLFSVSAGGRIVVHMGGPETSSVIEPRQLLSRQYQSSGSVRDFRTAFAVGDVNDDGRDDLVFAEGTFDTGNLEGTHDWKVLLAQPNGSAVERTLSDLPTTTVNYSGVGANEFQFFMAFYYNIAQGIKPIIADLTGTRRNEIVFPLRTSRSGDEFRWTLYSTASSGSSSVSLSELGIVPNLEAGKYKSGSALNVVGNGKRQLLFQGIDDNDEKDWKLYSYADGIDYLYQLESAISSDCKPYFLDIHGDGLTDIVFDCGSSGQLFVSNGFEWELVDSDIANLGNYLSPDEGGIQIGDPDGDGRSNLLFMPSWGGGTWHSITVYDDGDFTTFDTELPYTLASTDINAPDSGYSQFIDIVIGGIDFRNQAVQVGDFTGDGIPDFIQANAETNRWDLYSSTRNKQYGIQRVTDNHENETSIIRTTLADNSVYMSVVPANREFREAPRSLSVVQEVRHPDGNGGDRTVSYEYTGSKYHFRDLGFTGFDSIEKSDSATRLSTRTVFEQEYSDYRWPLNGQPKSKAVSWSGGTTSGPVQVEVMDWGLYSTRGESQFPYIERTISAELDGTGRVASVTDVSSEIDAESGVVSNLVRKTGSGSLVNGRPVLSQIDHQKTVARTNISNNTSSWLLGFVGNVRETSTTYNASGADEKTVENRFTQWPGTLDVATSTAFPDDPKLTYIERKSYDSRGNLVSISLEGNSNFESRQWTYSDFQAGQYPAVETAPLNSGVTGVSYDYRYGKKTAETGPNGLVASMAYDGFGRLVREESGSGVVTQYVYEKCEGNCSLPGQDAHQPWYKVSKTVTHPQAPAYGEPPIDEYYDSLGRKIGTSKVGFAGETIHQVWKYDAAGREIFVSKPFKGSGPKAYTLHSNYDFADRALNSDTYSGSVLVRQQRQSYVYSNPGIERTVTITSTPEGTSGAQHTTVSKTKLGSDGTVSEVAEGVGTTDYVSTAYEHDAHGNIARVQVHANDKTTVTRDYDAAGNLTLENDPDAGQKIYTHDALGNLVSSRDANGHSIAVQYDALNRILSRTDYTEATQVGQSEWFYDLSEQCNPNGRFIGRLCLKKQSSGFEESYQYDAFGQLEVTSTIIPGFDLDGPRSFIHVRDAFGREEARSYPNGFTAYFNHNSNGYLEAVRDNNGQLLKTVNGLDSRGSEESVLLGNGLVVSQTFSDLSGNLRSTNVPNAIQENYAWYGNGSLYSKTNQGRSQTYTYDGLSRLSGATGFDPVSGENRSNTYTYDSLGNLLSKPGVVSAVYEDAQRPHAVTQVTYDQSAGVQQPVEEYQYSQAAPCPDGGEYLAGKCEYSVGEIPAADYEVVTNAQCPSGLVAMGEECFEPVDWVCGKYDFVSTGLFRDDKCGVVYKAGWTFGTVTESCPADLPNSRNTFKLFSGINKICYDDSDSFAVCPSGSTQVPGEPQGTCVSTTPDQSADVERYCSMPGQNQDATSAGIVTDGEQCWQTETPIAPYCPTGFSPSEGKDLASDWNDSDACFKTELVNPDSGNSGETVFNYAYDSNGNVIERGEQTITYTPFNKPAVITGSGGTSRFWYGPDRARYRQDSREGATLYFGSNYEEVHTGSKVVEKAFVGDFLQVVTENEQERFEYLHRDHLGSVRAVTDEQANAVALFEYAPFGKKVGDDPVSNRGFTDHEHLEESGLIHMNGRIYDPFAGRFMSPDPVVQRPYLSQNYNRYSYVLNDPLSMTDPSGYCYVDNGIDCFGYAWDQLVGVFNTASSEWDSGNYLTSAVGYGLGAAHSLTVLPVQFINQGILSVGNNTYRGTTDIQNGDLSGAAFHYTMAAGELAMGGMVSRVPDTPFAGRVESSFVSEKGLGALRSSYLQQVEDLTGAASSVRAAGLDADQALRVLAPLRNELKLEVRAQGSWMAARAADLRNIFKYGNRAGPSAEELIRQYGTAENALEALGRTSSVVNRVVGVGQ